MSCCCCFLIYPVGLFITLYLLKRYICRGRYTKPTLIENKVVIITGANTGIGKKTAIDLAKRGGKIYIACRDKKRGEDALEDIRKISGSDRVYFLQLDLASLKSIREFSHKFHQLENKLDILINNAGLVIEKRATTSDGFEMHMGVNHLGHFLLTNLLIDLLKAAAPSRIVVVSSFIHKMCSIDKDDFMIEKNFSGHKAYGISKLANILFTHELSKQLKCSKVTVNSCHPGVIKTEIIRDYKYFAIKIFSLLLTIFSKTPEEGAQTQIMLAVDPSLEETTGKYYSNCMEDKASREACNDEVAKWLWKKSSDLVSL